MKIISEYKLTTAQIKEYRSKGYEIYYGYEDPIIKPGESVGFLLDNLYSKTIERITDLLYRKKRSIITIKYKDKLYTIDCLTDWQEKHWDGTTKHNVTTNHPILTEYYNKRAEYKEHHELVKANESMNILLDYFNNKIPDDLDTMLSTFARLYQLDIDYDSLDSRLRAYMNIKFYLDNNIEYCNDIIGVSPTEESRFEVTMYGDIEYLEDVAYREGVLI